MEQTKHLILKFLVKNGYKFLLNNKKHKGYLCTAKNEDIIKLLNQHGMFKFEDYLYREYLEKFGFTMFNVFFYIRPEFDNFLLFYEDFTISVKDEEYTLLNNYHNR